MGNNASNRSRPVSIYTEDELLNFNGVKSLSTDNNNNTTQIGCNSIISELEEDSNVSLNLRFHEVRGKNIELRENGRQAVRSEKSFCDAIVFTQRPVRVYEKVYFRIGRVSTLWNGMIRFGFSSVDPEALRERPASDSLPSEDEYDPDANFYLPKYLYPTLTNKKGYWAGALGNECLLKEHDVFYFFYNFEGEVHYGVNHKWMGKFLEGVDVYGDRAPPSMQPLWAVFDVYGNTLEIELLEADYDMQMNLNSAAHSSRHHRRSDRMSSLMAPLDGPMNLRTMSIVNSAASDANHNHNLTAASSSSSHSSDNTVVMNPSNMNLNSLGDSIYSSTSSEGSNGSTLSANSVLWANSIMTTVIPTNRLTSNGNFNRQLHVPNQVVMRPKPATTSTNGRPEESNSRLTSNTPDKNNNTSSQIDRLLISCRRLCVDNHLNQTLHNSILEANNTTKAQMTSPTTVMTSSNQRPSQIVSRTATEGNMNRAISDLNTRIREFYESIPVLLHDSCTVRRSMYRFMTSVCGKNVNVCQPDSLIAYRQSSIAQLRERHNSQGTNSSSSSSQETAIRRAATQNAYVFLDKPVEKGKYVCIQIVGLDQSAHESSASLSIGCTTCQPSTLSPDIDLPDDADELVDRPEYWVVMKSIFSLQHVARKHQVALADELCFHVDDKSGNVRLFINGTLITECLFSVDITQTLYFFFDLCGKINAIRLIAQCQSSNSSTLNNNTAITSGNNNSKRNSALIDYFKSHLAIDEENSNNNEANNNVTNNTTTNRQSKSRESEGGTNECCICWNGPIECVLYTCGHMCLCWNCASALKKQSAKRGNSKPKPATCPICRLEIVDIIRAYRP